MAETRWRVFTLPRQDGIKFTLELVTPTDDPEVVAAIEASAARAGMSIARERVRPEGEPAMILDGDEEP